MRSRTLLHSTLIVLLASILLAPLPARPAAHEGWTCAACGCVRDGQHFDQPGTCPVCGMELIPMGDYQAPAKAPVTVAILVFDGVQIIDFAAPWEVFGQAHFEVFTVSPDGKPVTTTMGMHLTPDYGFADAPEANVLLVPGGHIHDVLRNEQGLDWIQRMSQGVEHVLSVCNGAFLLAEAGLLDGGTATTFYGLIHDLEETYPQVHVVRDQRYTDNGKVLTSAGLSSGIDASLYLVSKIQGMDRARSLALHLEYDWDPQGTFIRGALADRLLPTVDIDLPGAELRQLSALGDENSWETHWAVEPPIEPRAIVASFAKALAQVPRWRMDGEPSDSATSWRVSTEEDGLWRATLRVSEGESGQQTVSTRLERVP
jgi:putative intracellular protease/amidase